MPAIYDKQRSRLLAKIRDYILKHSAEFDQAKGWLQEQFGADTNGVCRPDRDEHDERRKRLAECVREAKAARVKVEDIYPIWQLDGYRTPPTKCRNTALRSAFLALTALLDERKSRFDLMKARGTLLLAVACRYSDPEMLPDVCEVFGDWSTDGGPYLGALGRIHIRFDEWMELVKAEWESLPREPSQFSDDAQASGAGKAAGPGKDDDKNYVPASEILNRYCDGTGIDTEVKLNRFLDKTEKDGTIRQKHPRKAKYRRLVHLADFHQATKATVLAEEQDDPKKIEQRIEATRKNKGAR